MSNVNTSLYRQLADGQIYSDPSKPDFTVRFKTTSSQKSLNGVPVQNYVHEVIYNDNNDVTVNSVNAVDALSVRLRVSGSSASSSRLAEIVAAMCSQAPTWIGTDHTATGFPPAAVPVNPNQA